MLHIDSIEFHREMRVFTRLSPVFGRPLFLAAPLFSATPPHEMAARSSQQPTPHVIPMNNANDTLADLSEDEISFPSDARHAIHPGMHKSGDVHAPAPIPFGTGVPTPFILGRTSPARDQHLETILHQLMVNSFTFMNGRIQGLAQQLQESAGSNAQFQKMECFNLDVIMATNTDAKRAHQKCLLTMESKLDDLLQQSDASKHINNELLEAYHVLLEENTLLKAAMEELMRKITEQTATHTPPSPDIANNPCAGEGMSLQLFDVQRDIQDVLEVVRNTAGKRKRAPSTNYDDRQPTSSSARRLIP
jgi:hypothetical protein